MALILILFLVLFFIYFTLTIIGQKYKNPYTLTLILGKCGSGKSTLLTKFALKHIKKGWNVFTTDKSIPIGTFVDIKELPYYNFPPHSAIFIDEIGIAFDNRQFKSFTKDMTVFWKYRRHKKLRIFAASQNYDCDKKIRDTADYIYIVQNKFNIFSYGKRVLRKLCLTEAYGNQPGCISENLVFDSLLCKGGRIITYIPKYIKFFNSFSNYEE